MQALFDHITQLTPPDAACRLLHGRGGRFPGCEHLTLDAYPPALVLTSFLPLTQAQLQAIDAALQARYAQLGLPLCWVYQQRQSGTPATTELMRGVLPEPHPVREAGAQYLVRVLQGQNHGLFLDMATGRAWVRQHVQALAAQGEPQPKVLNLFAYSCAFSVVALQAGAQAVVNVDMASGALALGQANHRLNGLSGARFLAHDIFKSWGKLTRLGPYALVIADPPSYQKGSFVASKDYARLLRRLPSLIAPGGHALLCLNAPELGSDFLRQQVAEHAPELAFVQRLPNPPVFADVDEERSLKVLLFKRPYIQEQESRAENVLAF